MGKKRVHELAKEYGLDNKEVIQRLQAAGISVKTHSSSVYEDEARAVLDKVAERPAKKPKKRRPGMMIVRKRDQDASETDNDTEAAEQDENEAVAGQAAAETPETEVAAEAASPARAEAPTAAVEAQPGDAAAEPAPPTESEAAAAAEVQQGAAAEASEAEAAAGTAEPVAEQAAEAEAAGGAAEGQQAAEGDGEKKPEAPKRRPGAAKVVRMIDRDKLLERVPSNRLGGGPGSQRGGQKFGQVTELRVVTDPYGRGREMITVGKDKKGRKGVKRTRTPTKREMMEMRERAMHPARLKRKKAMKRSGGKKTPLTQPKASKRVIKMKETITVADLAKELQAKATEIIGKLMGLGMMVTLNQPVDFETAQVVAQDYDYTVESVAFAEGAIINEPDEETDEANLEPRPPVVTVMGHVDHGKTSLLDAIRKARVAAGEAGGITQHIGAYSVKIPKKGSVTFVDTPGHAAFTEMRARGAQVTDIVVLVVAADDGVMPQTEEAIRHSQAAGVPIIVAINKIDRPEANAERVTQELTKFELLPEDWGGETLYVKTSATKGTGIKELLDAILLQAEMLELKADYSCNAVGVVVEAQLDKGRGPVATVLVQHGKLHRGDSVVVGQYAGKVRAMTDDTGKQVKEAGPSTAVEIIGLEGVPEAGDKLNRVDTPEQAREVATHRAEQKKLEEQSTGTKMSLDDLMKRMSGEETLELKVVLKADVQGSVEALRSSLEKLSTDEVKVNIIYGGVGAIKESDIMLASASDGLVIGFGVRPDSKARQLADREGVEIRTYNVIYEAIDNVRKAMEGLLSPEARESVVGRAEVRDLFRVSKVGTVAGCRVTEGKAMRSAKVRVLRDNVQVFDGRVASLRHFKDDVREVESGSECGVGVEGFNDIKQGDVLEFYQVEEVARTLDVAAESKRSSGGMEAHP